MDFRLYDGALGRFFGIDLLADLFTSHSPYHFAYNNPITFMDPTGLSSEEGGHTDLETIVINVNSSQLPDFGTRPPYFGEIFPSYFLAISDANNGYGGGPIINNSKESVFYKPENTSESKEIKPGETIDDLVDGIKVNNMVVKVTDGYSKIIINPDRSVDVFYNNPFRFLYYKMKGGQIKSSPDKGWDNLFNSGK